MKGTIHDLRTIGMVRELRHMNNSVLSLLRQVLCFVGFGATILFGQSHSSNGELRGTLTDVSSALIPNATVTLKREATGLTRQVTTNADGSYHLFLIPPGEYEVEFAKQGFRTELHRGVQVTVGEIATLDAQLQVGVLREAVVVTAEAPLLENYRSQQANTLVQQSLANLPIDRRDYLTFTLLTPGVTEANTIADNTDLRVKQTPQSGLSFFGSNGRGNSITVDGGEANDTSGGVRSTLPQEAVQEFQINRSNYSAELGSASGGAVNILSKSGTNALHGSVFDYWRNQIFDAANPFARILTSDGNLVRTKPPAKRQQFGGSIGGPLKKDRTFVFGAFEGLVRRESSVVSILTDRSIFQPTPAQMQVISQLPADQAAVLQSVLTASPSTVALFEKNSGVFPFQTDSWRFSTRLDHQKDPQNYFFFRHNLSHVNETNANVQALVGASRGYAQHQFDPTTAAGWVHIFSPQVVNEARAQWAYRSFDLNSLDPFGPELRINGYGVFNKDFLLPSRTIEQRYEFRDNVTLVSGAHTWKFGTQVLVRGTHSDNEVFFAGRFTFGDLPGSILNPLLPPTFTINALQAFNLGLAQTYQQGSGNPTVASTQPYSAFYVQDSWRVRPNLTLDLGVRYEIDVRKAPVPTDKNNFAPRAAFAWTLPGHSNTVVRGAYGIFYSPTYYQIDWVVNALNEVNGERPIAQAFTSILTPGPAAANNIFTTLRNQGAIGIPVPTGAIGPAQVAPFGITFPHSGPLPPFSVLFGINPNFVNPYSQQTFLSIERQLSSDTTITLGYTYARTLRLPWQRDQNLLDAPVDPQLGIRVWSSPQYFADPLAAQRNIFESTANSFYKGLTVEFKKRFSHRFGLDANYTLSKAMDDTTDFSADFQAADQTNRRGEHALSSFDQRHNFVVYGTWTAPKGFLFSPIFRANSGRPFNLLVGYDLNQDRHDTTDRPAGAARNTGLGPNFWTLDVRLGREFRLSERGRLTLTLEAFNLLNRLNYSSVNNVVGNMAGPFQVSGRDDRLPTQPLGFTSARDPRRLQLGLRLSF